MHKADGFGDRQGTRYTLEHLKPTSFPGQAMSITHGRGPPARCRGDCGRAPTISGIGTSTSLQLWHTSSMPKSKDGEMRKANLPSAKHSSS